MTRTEAQSKCSRWRNKFLNSIPSEKHAKKKNALNAKGIHFVEYKGFVTDKGFVLVDFYVPSSKTCYVDVSNMIYWIKSNMAVLTEIASRVSNLSFHCI